MPNYLVRIELIEEIWVEAENEEEACGIAEAEAREHINGEVMETDEEDE